MEVDNNSLRMTSLQLYHFLCQHIVGTKKTVRTKRIINTINDNSCSDDRTVLITSGSIGEGLELKGSDLDVMLVLNDFIVHENTENINHGKINLVMEMIDTKPGFTQLRAHNFPSFIEIFEQRGNSWYLSSWLLKLYFLKISHETGGRMLTKFHGPCLSDSYDFLDSAFCLHSPHWIQLAENWISRGHTSWPRSDVKSDIIDHGVLFVPIGSEGSNNEALEWRISFSVAEKLLIYSFNHTQLLCYALMKILLKDLINSNINCKNLLCSYFIKTTMFWVSEETPMTEWKPENFIQCFMKCFRRLLYCVEYSMCPHYFIPTINMFENKIDEQHRKLLLGHLNILFSFGWRCVLFSEQFQNFTIHSNALQNSIEIESAQFQLMLTSYSSYVYTEEHLNMSSNYKRCIRILNVNKSFVIKLSNLRAMSLICSKISQSIVFPSDINKMVYSQRREQLAYLLQNIHYDAVSGWIMLATFFYKTKQYSYVLDILSYVMMKCTPEKVFFQKRLSQLQLKLTESSTLQRLGILRVLKLVTVDLIKFQKGSTLIPEELALERLNVSHFPPVVFAHFLSFLCHYHCNDIQHCYNSIRDIQLTIDEKYLCAHSQDIAQGYILLGVAFQLVGQSHLAIFAFKNATQCETVRKTTAAERLSMMYMHFKRN